MTSPDNTPAAAPTYSGTPSGANNVIQADPAVLRAQAAICEAQAEELAALIPAFKEINTELRASAAANTADSGPSPIFTPLLQSMDIAQHKILSGLDQAHANVLGDAAAFRQLANDLENTDQDSGKRISNTSSGTPVRST